MIDLDAPRFTTLEGCAAAGIRSSTLNRRLAKGLDNGYLLPLRPVYQITLTAELIRRGTTLQRAGNLAALFTDKEVNRPTERLSNSNDAHRHPGHLFQSGGTILVANNDGWFGPIIAAVVNPLLVDFSRRHITGALVVDVEEVANRMLTSLRLTDQRTVVEMEPALPRTTPSILVGAG